MTADRARAAASQARRAPTLGRAVAVVILWIAVAMAGGAQSANAMHDAGVTTAHASGARSTVGTAANEHELRAVVRAQPRSMGRGGVRLGFAAMHHAAPPTDAPWTCDVRPNRGAVPVEGDGDETSARGPPR